MRKYIPILASTVFIAVAILTVLFYKGTVPCSLSVIGRIVPCRELNVSRGVDGMITVTVSDNVRGTQENSFIMELTRGDVVTLNSLGVLAPGTDVAQGDTLFRIHSTEIEQELTDLGGELAIQKASLALAQTGEKQSIIETAQILVDSAREKLTQQERITGRQKDLYDSGFIPYQDYELAMNQLTLNRISVQDAESQLSTVRTGVKTEEIDLIRSQTTSLEQRIAVLTEKNKKFTILAPFSGRVIESGTVTDAITIGDVSGMCIVLPIELKSSRLVKVNQAVTLKIDGVPGALRGTILTIGNSAHLVADQQVVIATAGLNEKNMDIPAGILAECRILLEPVTLREYCIRTMNTFF